MANIKQAVWGNPDYRFFVITQYQKQGRFGDMADLVKFSTESLDVSCVEADDAAPGRGKLAYVVFCKPLTHERYAYAEWVGFFTSPGSYRHNVYKLVVEKKPLDCKVCKDTAHSALACPLPMTEGWQGPTLGDIYPQKNALVKPGPSAGVVPSKQAQQAWKEVPKKGKGKGNGGAPAAGRSSGSKKGAHQRERR